MLKCRDVSSLATEYEDGALSLRRRLAVRLHLGICAMCRNYFDQLAKTRRLMRGRPLAGPEAAAEERIIAAARAPHAEN